MSGIEPGPGHLGAGQGSGLSEATINRQRDVRNDYYREYLRTEAIEMMAS